MLLTHPLLDMMTIYGTQLRCRGATSPVGYRQRVHHRPAVHAGAALIGTGVALVRRADARRRWNAAGLAL